MIEIEHKVMEGLRTIQANRGRLNSLKKRAEVLNPIKTCELIFEALQKVTKNS